MATPATGDSEVEAGSNGPEGHAQQAMRNQLKLNILQERNGADVARVSWADCRRQGC